MVTLHISHTTDGLYLQTDLRTVPKFVPQAVIDYLEQYYTATAVVNAWVEHNEWQSSFIMTLTGPRWDEPIWLAGKVYIDTGDR